MKHVPKQNELPENFFINDDYEFLMKLSGDWPSPPEIKKQSDIISSDVKKRIYEVGRNYLKLIGFYQKHN